MDMNSSFAGLGGISSDDPIATLQKDHDLARQLFKEYFGTEHRTRRDGTGRRILLLLETHSVLEENVLYWRACVVDPVLVERCEHEHGRADAMIARLKSLMEDGVGSRHERQVDAMFRRLADEILPHMAIEEQQLFPRVRNSEIDLDTIAREMQAFETMLIASRMRSTGFGAGSVRDWN